MVKPSIFQKKSPSMVERFDHIPWFVDVSVLIKFEKLQVALEVMEQAYFWEHFPSPTRS